MNSSENPNSGEKLVNDVEFGSTDGRVEYRLRFEDGSVGNWEQTEIQTNETGEFQAFQTKLRRELGLDAGKEESY